MDKPSSEPAFDVVIDPKLKARSVHSNLQQDIIVITVDRVKICLIEKIRLVEDRNKWIAPFGILLTIGVVFPTASFRDWILKKETWEAVFVVAAIASLAWLIVTLVQRPRAVSVDDIINGLKHDGVGSPDAERKDGRK